MLFKSPFRAGVKIIALQNHFAHHRYPEPKGSADYDTAEMKLNQIE
jgi:hypothetical protein